MSKLPTDFVKAPAPRPKKPRKQTLVAADPREVLLRLTDDELRVLEDARQALERAGERVTLEQLIHRVIAEWTVRRQAPEPVALEDRIRDRLRTFAAAPLRTWRELGATLRRMSGLALH